MHLSGLLHISFDSENNHKPQPKTLRRKAQVATLVEMISQFLGVTGSTNNLPPPPPTCVQQTPRIASSIINLSRMEVYKEIRCLLSPPIAHHLSVIFRSSDVKASFISSEWQCREYCALMR